MRREHTQVPGPPAQTKRLVAVQAAVLSLALAGSSPAVAAPTGSPTADANAVSDATPVLVGDAVASQERTAGGAVAESDDGTVAIEIPADPGDGITIDRTDGPTIKIGLPFSDTSRDARFASDGTAVFHNRNDSSTVPVAGSDGSLALHTVIASAEAPERYQYEISADGVVGLRVASDGSVALLDAAGSAVAAVAAPWARDADGTAIPTRYEVNGMTLTQVVDHRNAKAVVYPVVADPWLGIDLISRVGYSWTRSGLSFMVYPTGFGRAAPQYMHNGNGWKEAVSKGVWSWQGLYEQYVCHPFSAVARAKSSWNLDTWRPTVGFWPTVWAKCNP